MSFLKGQKMAGIQWSEKMSVGNNIIDQQHKKLVQMVNSLFDAMAQGKGDQVLEPTIKELAIYTKTHFDYEEQFMRQIGYPQLEEHQQVHRDLLGKVKGIYDKIAAGEHYSSVTLAGFLKEWLTKHIMGVDQKYAAFSTVGARS